MKYKHAWRCTRNWLGEQRKWTRSCTTDINNCFVFMSSTIIDISNWSNYCWRTMNSCRMDFRSAQVSLKIQHNLVLYVMMDKLPKCIFCLPILSASEHEYDGFGTMQALHCCIQSHYNWIRFAISQRLVSTIAVSISVIWFNYRLHSSTSITVQIQSNYVTLSDKTNQCWIDYDKGRDNNVHNVENGK